MSFLVLTKCMRKKAVDDFFLEVQKEANYIDVTNIKPIYYALLRTILNRLHSDGTIVLPDWGQFRVVKHKSRRSRDLNNPGEFLILPAIKTAKFSPCGRLKNFVRNLKDKPDDGILKM